MSKNTNLSFLTDYITADITNGRIGINNASPTVAFDVVGATKITGVLTLTSTISNGTYAYTLPSATGTLALTSSLSGYLPLTGGTLTGALGGTSASFSSTITGTQATFTATANTYAGGALILKAFGGTNPIYLTSVGGYFAVSNGGSSDHLLITSTGAATFSSSVTASDLIISDTYANDPLIKLATTTSGSVEVQMRTASTTYNAGIGVVTSGYDFNFFTANSTRMTITSDGNVGIGTSTPATFLHVLGANTTNRGQLSIQSNNVSNGARATWYYDTFNSGEIGTTSANFYATATNDFLFYAGGSERMRIAGSGDIMFKDTSGNNVVYFTAANPSLSFSYAVLNRTASSPMYWNSGTGQIGLNTSARRFKKDIVSITPEQTKIALLLNPVEYTRIETNEKEFGFIAEEVRDAGLGCFVPEIDGEALTIDYSKLSVFAIAMIKEQQKAIQELSAKVTLLENK